VLNGSWLLTFHDNLSVPKHQKLNINHCYIISQKNEGLIGIAAEALNHVLLNY